MDKIRRKRHSVRYISRAHSSERNDRKIVFCGNIPPGFARFPAVLGLLAIIGLLSQATFAQEQEVIESGRQKFNQTCAVCHGLNGGGDGELGKLLEKQPADVTRLSARNDGSFRYWEVYAKIDGRDTNRSHGPGDMPMWGPDDKGRVSSGRLSRLEILEIVFFLQSIQQE